MQNPAERWSDVQRLGCVDEHAREVEHRGSAGCHRGQPPDARRDQARLQADPVTLGVLWGRPSP